MIPAQRIQSEAQQSRNAVYCKVHPGQKKIYLSILTVFERQLCNIYDKKGGLCILWSLVRAIQCIYNSVKSPVAIYSVAYCYHLCVSLNAKQALLSIYQTKYISKVCSVFMSIYLKYCTKYTQKNEQWSQYSITREPVGSTLYITFIYICHTILYKGRVAADLQQCVFSTRGKVCMANIIATRWQHHIYL